MSRREFERPEEIRGHRYIRLGSGRLTTFWDNLTAAEKAHTEMSRHFSRAFKLVRDDYDLESLEHRVERLEDYAAALRKAIEVSRKVQSKRERIAQLRVVTGRTSEEAALFLRKADQLERELERS